MPLSWATPFVTALSNYSTLFSNCPLTLLNLPGPPPPPHPTTTSSLTENIETSWFPKKLLHQVCAQLTCPLGLVPACSLWSSSFWAPSHSHVDAAPVGVFLPSLSKWKNSLSSFISLLNCASLPFYMQLSESSVTTCIPSLLSHLLPSSVWRAS